MRYMLFIKHTEDYRGKVPPPALMQAMGEFVVPNIKSGKFIEAAGLMSTWRGKKVQLRDGKVSVIDGPFTESKEIIGGYTLIEAESDQEALDLAKQFIELHRIHAPDMQIECEMRPLQTGMPGSE
ncbi:MAG TPA: YciI family protein [Gemmatimonadaceae bacterium]|nr:YciI family protein [Gemmatimonadaceae bacterium]